MILIVPLAHPFARLMLRLVPEVESGLVRHLDRHLLSDPFIALEAVRTTTEDIFREQLVLAEAVLDGRSVGISGQVEALARALDKTERFLDEVHSQPERPREWQLLMACIHGLDHMARLNHRLRAAVAAAPGRAGLADRRGLLAQSIQRIGAAPHWKSAAQAAGELAARLEQGSRARREEIMGEVAGGRMDVDAGGDWLEADRWLTRVAHHLWRISHHLQLADDASHRDSPPLGAL